jgi:hypothetical protein
MRKGLTTLIAVAVALLGFQAMAMVPVVDDLRSPIVGNAESSTFDFFFPDAWDLDALVVDQETSDGGIRWSYVTGAFDGTFGPALSRYTLNGVEPQVDPSAAEAIEPPTAARIDNQVLGGEVNTDGNSRTVTIRDRILSPIGLPPTDPGASGIVASETVTLFASDGSTVTWATTIIFTDNNGADRFSGANITPDETLDGSTWTTSDFVYSGPSVSYTQNATTGACLFAALAGVNLPSLDSPVNRFSITDLQIIRLRMQMSSTSTAGTTPLISMTYNSPNNEFGGEMFVLDNVGAANQPNNGSNGRNEYQFVIGPPGLEAAAWRSAVDGAYAAANVTATQFKLVLRLLDVDGVVLGETRVGSVCWKTIEVGRVDLSALIAGETNVFTGTLAAANGTTGFSLSNIVDAWSVAFAGGVATISPPPAGGAGVSLATLRPGNGDGNAGSPAGLPDDYPVLWDTADQLLHIAYTATGTGNPPPVIRVGADTPTQEIIANHFMSQLGIGEKLMPTGTATTYHAFFYTHSTTNAVFANAGRIRPLLDLATRPDIVTPAPGSVAVSAVTVGDVSANNQ